MDVTTLPLPLAVSVFAHVPLHERARCACVSRGWRAMLRDPALWSVLDFGAVPRELLSAALVRGVAARGASAVRELHAWRATAPHDDDALLLPLLQEVVRANAGALRQLHVGDLQPHARDQYGRAHHFDAAELEALLWCAPRLERLEASLSEMRVERVCALLARAPLRLHELDFAFPTHGELDAHYDFGAAAAMLSCGLAAASHTGLRSLTISGLLGDDEGALSALAPGVAACPRLAALRIVSCELAADCDGALAAVLAGCDALEELSIDCTDDNSVQATVSPLLPPDERPEDVDGIGADEEAYVFALHGFAQLCAVLPSRRRLRSVQLLGVNLEGAPRATAALLAALGACPRFEQLTLQARLSAHDADALCLALASLLTAAPMVELRLHGCGLNDNAMRPLLAALWRAPHLRCFSWREDDAALRYDARSAGDDDSLFRDIILPAVQAPERLTELALPSGCALVRSARALADAHAAATAAAAALHDCVS